MRTQAHGTVLDESRLAPRFELIEATFATRRSLLEHVTLAADSCRLFWPTRAVLPARILVRVDLGLANEGERVVFQGRVLRGLEDIRNPTRSGLVIEATGEQAIRLAQAHARARGRPPEFARRDALRLRCRFDATLTIEGSATRVQVRDLARRGAFVETRQRAPRGMLVGVDIRLGWLRRLRALARVAWCGNRTDYHGMGLEFLELEPRDGRRLISVLDQLGR